MTLLASCGQPSTTPSGEAAEAAESAADGQSGQLTIGPLAMTRAICPPPSMDEKIEADMDAVRGYMIHDDVLSLSLMADAGIYRWKTDSEADEGESTTDAH